MEPGGTYAAWARQVPRSHRANILRKRQHTEDWLLLGGAVWNGNTGPLLKSMEIQSVTPSTGPRACGPVRLHQLHPQGSCPAAGLQAPGHTSFSFNLGTI